MAGETSVRKRQPKFIWSEMLSTTALREVFYTKPYQHVAGTADSAMAWKNCVTNLAEHRGEFVVLTVEKLRDHVRNLLNKRAAAVRELEKASGVSEEETELKELMDVIIAERDDFLSQHTANKEKEKEKEATKEVQGKDCRKKAMETAGETRKRKSAAGDSPETGNKRERRSSNDMFAYLNERSAERKAAHEEELQMRQKEMEARNNETNAVTGGILNMMQVMQDQITNRQQQQANVEREERDRREREEERRIQREQQVNQQTQLTSLLGALIKKLDK